MTREEAIYRLQNMAWIYGSAEREQNIEAVDMAIEALKADAVSLTGTMKYLTKPHNYREVVRCKDCCHRVHDEERGLYYCEMYYGQGDVSDENFCQWGERKAR